MRNRPEVGQGAPESSKSRRFEQSSGPCPYLAQIPLQHITSAVTQTPPGAAPMWATSFLLGFSTLWLQFVRKISSRLPHFNLYSAQFIHSSIQQLYADHQAPSEPRGKPKRKKRRHIDGQQAHEKMININKYFPKQAY